MATKTNRIDRKTLNPIKNFKALTATRIQTCKDKSPHKMFNNVEQKMKKHR